MSGGTLAASGLSGVHRYLLAPLAMSVIAIYLHWQILNNQTKNIITEAKYLLRTIFYQNFRDNTHFCKSK